MNTEQLYEHGLLPDRYYYQLNEKSPQENYAEQKQQHIEETAAEDETETTIVFRTVVKTA